MTQPNIQTYNVSDSQISRQKKKQFQTDWRTVKINQINFPGWKSLWHFGKGELGADTAQSYLRTADGNLLSHSVQRSVNSAVNVSPVTNPSIRGWGGSVAQLTLLQGCSSSVYSWLII